MEPHQQRVVEEKRELDEKAARLAAFIALPTATVSTAELGRLRVQHAIMDAYCTVLAERIAAFEGA